MVSRTLEQDPDWFTGIRQTGAAKEGEKLDVNMAAAIGMQGS